MKFLFWIAGILSFLGCSFALATLLGLQGNDGGAAMKLFLPMLGFGVFMGFIANFIRRFKPEAMGKNENAAGIILSMMTGIGAVVIILSSLGVF